MTKLHGVSGASSIPEPLPEQKGIPGPESFKMPSHHGEKTPGIKTEGTKAVFKTLDKHGVPMPDNASEMAIYALGIAIHRHLPGSQQ